MRKIELITIVVAFWVTGCAPKIALQKSEYAKYDFGKYPKNYKKIAKNWVNDTLKDPFSAKYRFKSKPVKGYTRKAPISGGDPDIFGYIVYVEVNAKNSFGAYVGWKEYTLLIKNGNVITSITPNSYFDEPWYQ